MGVRSPSVAERAKSVVLRPGVAMPDWSQVSAPAARAALEAIVDVVGLTAKFADLDPLEDAVWQAVLEGYADLGRAPRISEIACRLGISAEATTTWLRRLRARDQIVLDKTGDLITGAYPFTERPTGHRVRLGGQLNAMCAIDALGVGAMYGRDVAIESSCRHCGTAISIATAQQGLALGRFRPGKRSSGPGSPMGTTAPQTRCARCSRFSAATITWGRGGRAAPPARAGRASRPMRRCRWARRFSCRFRQGLELHHDPARLLRTQFQQGKRPL